MKKILIILLCSCKTLSPGKYCKEGLDYKYSLDLNNDSSFTLMTKVVEGSSECRGKWKFISKDSIILNCFTEDSFAPIRSGFMITRHWKIVVLRNGKLELDNTILKKCY